MNLASISTLLAGGPGSGRKPTKLDSDEAKQAAWLDKRQTSLFGPAHEQEIKQNAKLGKTRSEFKAGGPGSSPQPKYATQPLSWSPGGKDKEKLHELHQKHLDQGLWAAPDKWIGFDFDGTLATQPKEQYDAQHTGKPIAKMLRLLKHYVSKGSDVRIFTARADDEQAIKVLKAWCKRYIGKVLPVTNVKDKNMLKLYDDRAVNPKDVKAYGTSSGAEKAWDTRGRGKHTMGEREKRVRNVAQQVKLPSGATYYRGKPNLEKQERAPKITMPQGRLWPEQAYWRHGVPTVDKHEQHGNFKATNTDVRTFNLKNLTPMGKSDVYEANDTARDKGATVISQHDPAAGTGRITEFTHEAAGFSRDSKTGDRLSYGGHIQYDRGGRESGTRSGHALLLNLGSMHVIKFSSPRAQQTFLRQRYGIEKDF